MNIGILTQPLIHNYGGSLQNYALQVVLRNMGHYPKTIMWGINNSWIKWLLHNIIYAIKGQSLEMSPLAVSLRDKNFNQFHSKFISTTKTMGLIDPKIILKNDFDGYIVGSDQVWRKAYNSRLPYMFLSFLPNNTKRMSYAASIGVDTWDYSPELTQVCKEALKKFNIITVRESSAIELLATNIDIESYLVLDPTLLLKLDNYESGLNLSKRISSPVIAAYLLDINEEKISLLNNLSKYLGVEVNILGSPKYYGNFKSSEKEVYPTVESWIEGIRDAQYVITDSFHGTAFAINFNKPFISLQNEHRGNTRFNSLLRMFSLQSRILDASVNYRVIANELSSPIGWDKVNFTRSKLIEQSISYIKKVFQ